MRSASCLTNSELRGVLALNPPLDSIPTPPIMLALFLAQTSSAAPTNPASPGGGIGGLLVPFIFIFIMMYFIMIRPQARRQKEQQKLINLLKTGDNVITSSGIHGRITNVKDSTVMLKVDENVKIELDKAAIATVLKSNGAST
jgi:preprotein translocase subunit YajC